MTIMSSLPGADGDHHSHGMAPRQRALAAIGVCDPDPAAPERLLDRGLRQGAVAQAAHHQQRGGEHQEHLHRGGLRPSVPVAEAVPERNKKEVGKGLRRVR